MSGSDFQKRSTDQGKIAQSMAEQVVDGAGFQVTETKRKYNDLGVVANIVAVDDRGNEWIFDVTGSFHGRPGMQRMDTVWKALGRASVFNSAGHDRLVLLTGVRNRFRGGYQAATGF